MLISTIAATGGGAVVVNNNNHHYYIDRRIYLNLSNSIQSATGLKDLKSAANGRYLVCKVTIELFTCTVQKYIYPSVM